MVGRVILAYYSRVEVGQWLRIKDGMAEGRNQTQKTYLTLARLGKMFGGMAILLGVLFAIYPFVQDKLVRIARPVRIHGPRC